MTSSTRGLVVSHLVEVVVEIDIGRTKVSTEQGGMCGEDGGNLQVTGAAQNQPNSGHPFVELGHEEGTLFTGGVESVVDLLQEPGNAVAEEKTVVGFPVMVRNAWIRDSLG